MFADAEAGAILRQWKDRCGALGSSLVSRDGLVLFSNLPLAGFADTFAIMCATILGAATTATSELGRGPPHRVTIEEDGGTTIVVPVDPHALLVTVLGRDADLAKVGREVEAFATFLAARAVPSGGPWRRGT